MLVFGATWLSKARTTKRAKTVLMLILTPSTAKKMKKAMMTQLLAVATMIIATPLMLHRTKSFRKRAFHGTSLTRLLKRRINVTQRGECQNVGPTRARVAVNAEIKQIKLN